MLPASNLFDVALSPYELVLLALAIAFAVFAFFHILRKRQREAAADVALIAGVGEEAWKGVTKVVKDNVMSGRKKGGRRAGARGDEGGRVEERQC